EAVLLRDARTRRDAESRRERHEALDAGRSRHPDADGEVDALRAHLLDPREHRVDVEAELGEDRARETLLLERRGLALEHAPQLGVLDVGMTLRVARDRDVLDAVLLQQTGLDDLERIG